jgi:hypothetical protein
MCAERDAAIEQRLIPSSKRKAPIRQRHVSFDVFNVPDTHRIVPPYGSHTWYRQRLTT